MLTNARGFSGKEFLMVIVVIGILCLGALLPFRALQHSQRRAFFEQTVRSLQSDLATHSASPLPTLDQNNSAALCASCFDGVLKQAIKSPLWFKLNDSEYRFSIKNDPQNDPEAYFLKYDANTGTVSFTEPQ